LGKEELEILVIFVFVELVKLDMNDKRYVRNLELQAYEKESNSGSRWDKMVMVWILLIVITPLEYY